MVIWVLCEGVVLGHIEEGWQDGITLSAESSLLSPAGKEVVGGDRAEKLIFHCWDEEQYSSLQSL